MTPLNIALILISVALSSGSQIILKYGMTTPAVQQALQSHQLGPIFQNVALSPFVLGGLFCFGLSAVVWLFVLSQIPLSSAYPFVSIGICVTVLAGYAMFGESVSALTLAGVAAIILGIIMVGFGK
jgi:multidrug transporter EmrE-like cation transporter